MRKYFKKWFALLLCTVIMVSCSGCRKNKINNFYYFTNAKQELLAVYNALKAGDKVTLKSLLSKELQEQDDVDEQIDKFMDDIGGSIISVDFDKCHINNSGGSWNKEGYISMVVHEKILDVVCENNEKYDSLMVVGFPYYKINTNMVGINAITISKDYRIIHEITLDELR